MNKLDLNRNLQMRQEQILSHRQLQSLELLQLPTLALQQWVSQELVTNPVLEAENPFEELIPGDILERASEVERREEANSGDDDADVFEEMNSELQDQFYDELPIPGEILTESGERSSARDFRYNSLYRGPTLQDFLSDEIGYSDADPEVRTAALEIIGGIDDRGFLKTHLADVAQSSGVELDKVEVALKLIQRIAPAGVGARNLAESLKLQLERAGEQDETLFRLLDEFLPEVAQNHLPKVASGLGISMDELEQKLAKLKNLDPYPGGNFSPSEVVFATPDMEVVKEDGVWRIIMEEKFTPHLRIAERYLKMLEDSSLSKEDRKYLTERIAAARELMKSLALRKSTLYRVGEYLLDAQREFWDYGLEKLKPLTMRQAADALDLHETTVSRAVANKYLHCQWGFFELKFFFSSGFISSDGEEMSRKAILNKIRELIANEDPGKPLSDEKISKLLAAEKLAVARRTVAKYREELKIPPTNLRKKF